MIGNFIVSGSVKGIDLKTGKTVFENHNIFVQTGLNELAKLVKDKSGAVPSHIAVGTSNTEPVIGDTALKGSELGRKPFESSEITAASVKYAVTFLAGEATGVWEETGIFTAGSAGIMWSRALTGTYTKGAADEIKVYWTYKFENKPKA